MTHTNDASDQIIAELTGIKKELEKACGKESELKKEILRL